MTFWLLAVFLLLLTLVGTVWPLLAGSSRAADASDVQIYKDQLREIERDIDRGVVDSREGEASKTEIGRRLLAAARGADSATAVSLTGARITFVLLLVALPAASISGYLAFGSPGVPDTPLAARLDLPGNEGRIEDLVARVEEHLVRRPNDGDGWKVIAPVYARLGRLDEAVQAYGKAVRLTEPDADLLSSYGEAMVMQASGIVPEAARRIFEQSATMNPSGVKARFYLAMALNQDRRYAEAIPAWTGLLEGAPDNAPWAAMARSMLTAARTALQNEDDTDAAPGSTGGPTAEAPGPSRAEIEAAQSLSEDDRQAFIESMVSGLSERLDADGGTVDEWIRLVRAYTVMGRADDARSAVRRARAAHAEDEAALTRLDDAAQSLGVE